MKSHKKNNIPMMIGIAIGIVLILGFAVKSCVKAVTNIATDTIIEKALEQSTGTDATVDTTNGVININTKDGSFSTSNTLPTSWPSDAPVYPGATIQYSGTSPTSGTAVIMQTTEASDIISTYYIEQAEQNGWTLENNAQVSGNSVLSFTKGSQSLSVLVTPTADGSTITMGITTK